MKAWSDVIQSQDYQSLDPQQKYQAQLQYFNDVVSPKVNKNEKMAAAQEFFNTYKPEIYSTNVTKDMPFYEKAWVGLGSTYPGIGRGIKQIAAEAPQVMRGIGKIATNPTDFSTIENTKSDQFGSTNDSLPPTPEVKRLRQEQYEASGYEKNLGGWGTAGKIVGNAGVFAPAMAIPGANTALGSTLTGMAMGFTQPVGEDESRVMNAATGAATGYGGYKVGAEYVPNAIDWSKRKAAELAVKQSQNAARDATLEAARTAGYQVPPSEVKPNVLTNLLEKWAGKASVAQQASLNNQKVTNQLARDAIGLSESSPLIPEQLTPLKQQAWGVYDKVKNIGPIAADKEYKTALSGILDEHGGSLLQNESVSNLVDKLSKDSMSSKNVVDTIKQLRFNAKTNLSPLAQNPDSRALGKAQSAAADALEGLVERNLGNSKLLNEFRSARIQLGKIGTIERAMNDATGDISARSLASQLDKGVPLTGDLKTAAKFGMAYPKYVQNNVNPIPGGSPLDATASIATSIATKDPSWLGLMAGRPLARRLALSKILASKPSYELGVVPKLLQSLDGSVNPELAGPIASLLASSSASKK